MMKRRVADLVVAVATVVVDVAIGVLHGFVAVVIVVCVVVDDDVAAVVTAVVVDMKQLQLLLQIGY